MKLLIDIGNTRIKWALAADTTVLETGAIERADVADWTDLLPATLVHAIHVASVAHKGAMQRLEDHAAARKVALHRVTSAARFGPLVNAYTQPERLGVDRWLACIAAHARARRSVLIADAGTALTLDFVAADGRHGGGLIAPGVVSMRAALRTKTQLRPQRAPETPVWLATDTDSAIAAGTLRSALSLLDDAADELKPERLLLTGGEAALLAPHLNSEWQLAPHLVLEGLAIHAGQHASQASE